MVENCFECFAYFIQNNLTLPFKSNLQGATDFQTLWGIQDAMTRDFGWNYLPSPKLLKNNNPNYLHRDSNKRNSQQLIPNSNNREI